MGLKKMWRLSKYIMFAEAEPILVNNLETECPARPRAPL